MLFTALHPASIVSSQAPGMDNTPGRCQLVIQRDDFIKSPPKPAPLFPGTSSSTWFAHSSRMVRELSDVSASWPLLSSVLDACLGRTYASGPYMKCSVFILSFH